MDYVYNPKATAKVLIFGALQQKTCSAAEKVIASQIDINKKGRNILIVNTIALTIKPYIEYWLEMVRVPSRATRVSANDSDRDRACSPTLPTEDDQQFLAILDWTTVDSCAPSSDDRPTKSCGTNSPPTGPRKKIPTILHSPASNIL
jgi:hypothetical protein